MKKVTQICGVIGIKTGCEWMFVSGTSSPGSSLVIKWVVGNLLRLLLQRC